MKQDYWISDGKCYIYLISVIVVKPFAPVYDFSFYMYLY